MWKKIVLVSTCLLMVAVAAMGEESIRFPFGAQPEGTSNGIFTRVLDRQEGMLFYYSFGFEKMKIGQNTPVTICGGQMCLGTFALGLIGLNLEVSYLGGTYGSPDMSILEWRYLVDQKTSQDQYTEVLFDFLRRVEFTKLKR